MFYAKISDRMIVKWHLKSITERNFEADKTQVAD